MVIVPLLLTACGGKDPIVEVPPPTPVDNGEQGNGNGGNNNGGNDDTPKPWDVNRGKEVHPSAGSGWTVTQIDDGIVYYAFEGKEPVTNANQRIFVTDIDLNKDYSVKLVYYSGRSTASQVFKSKGAVACINGGYEMGSLWVRVNNTTVSSLPNDYITSGDYQVPQWKSEAAVYLDNDQDVRIEFTGKDMNLAQWRAVYRERSKTEKNLITSAPMLIDDYEPVGEDFCAKHPAQYPKCSEDPYVHQSSTTNPRTALAKTEFNHVLFIVVDGRRNISRGISAAELTKFLVKNFNPQYAINLDGGGSSTMCVAGQGDPDTHVVNYPTDSDKVNARPGNGDHTGERSVPTFFYVVKK